REPRARLPRWQRRGRRRDHEGRGSGRPRSEPSAHRARMDRRRWGRSPDPALPEHPMPGGVPGVARRARLVSDDTVAELQSWVRAVVSELVTAPTTICVERIAETGPTVLLALRLDEGDLGRVIGRHGLIIQSLRSLVAAAGARRGLQVRLEVPQARSGR